MKCEICNGYHNLWENCKKDDNLYNILYNVPKYEPPTIDPPKFNLEFDPILPKIEPLSYDVPKINLNLDPIFPKYDEPGQGGPLDAGFHQQQIQMGHLDLPYFKF